MRPSLLQITPEPLPRPPAWTSTVERRSCSAISPKPSMAMLVSAMWAFAHRNVCFLHHTTANKLQRQRLADGFAVKLRMNVFQTRDGTARQQNENVADDDPGFLRRPFRLNLQNDGGSFFFAL